MNKHTWEIFKRIFEADKQLQKDREALHHTELDFDIDLCDIAFDLISITPSDGMLDAWFNFDYEQVKLYCDLIINKKEIKRD